MIFVSYTIEKLLQNRILGNISLITQNICKKNETYEI